tara:strand:- start:366 stop:866 length:501 start_codon:yes stop_codon:yes gene_type:complete
MPALIAIAGILQASAPPAVCGITDTASMSAEETQCVQSLGSQILSDMPDPLEVSADDLTFAETLYSPHACSFHGARLQASWPVRPDGTQIEVETPVRVSLTYAWQNDGRATDVQASIANAGGLSEPDAALFEASARDAVTRYALPPACLTGPDAPRTDEIIFQMTD